MVLSVDVLGCDVEKARDEVGHSALMITALNGDLDALKCLVDAKVGTRGGGVEVVKKRLGRYEGSMLAVVVNTFGMTSHACMGLVGNHLNSSKRVMSET